MSPGRCYNLAKKKQKRNKFTKEERNDTMTATTQNFLYEIKVDKNKEKNEKLISKELLELCQKVAEKYPLKK